MQRLAWIAALLAALSASAAMAASVYKWSDARGQTHYGEIPPVGRSAQKINIQTPPKQPGPAASQTTAIPGVSTNSNSPEAAATQGESDPRAQPLSRDPQPPRPSCATARQNLQYLQGGPGNRRFRDPSGHVVRYTEAQRQAKIAATEHYLEQHCPTQ